jgi:mRNA interferase MazF
MKRGDIYFAALDSTLSGDMQKTRPVVIVSNNAANKSCAWVTVVPLSSQIACVYPFEVLLRAAVCGLNKDSKAMAQQVRTLDKQRLSTRRAGFASDEQLIELDGALKLHLAL